MRGKDKTAWHYIKKYKFGSLLLQNFCTILLLVVTPILLVVSVNYKKFTEEVNSRMMYMNAELLQKSAVVIDNVMYGVIELMEQMIAEDVLIRTMEAKKEEEVYEELSDHIVDLIRQYMQMNQYIKKIYVYSDINDQLIDDRWSQDIHTCRNVGKWYDLYKNMPMNFSCVLADGQQSILFCQPVINQVQEDIGLIVFEVNLQKIGELLEKENLLQSGIFFVVDISGQVMYCSEQEYDDLSQDRKKEYRNQIGRTPIGETRYADGAFSEFVSVEESDYKSWRYALIKERSMYEEETGSVNDFFMSILFVSFFISMLVSYIITTITYRPIKHIVEAIEKPQEMLDNTEGSKRSGELMYITSNILNTLNTKDTMHKEMLSRMETLKKTQTLALQFQMDPHFLYNTLETIKWSAVEEMGIGSKVSKLITKTAKLYRITLESNKLILTLREELEYLELYIDIISTRYGERIRFLYNIDRSLYECNVIKMCIQPLVENAINHGLREKKYCGTITILAYRREDKLCIAVEDDGQGITEGKMQWLNEELQNRYELDGVQVGLRNINERIKLIYGQKYGASVHYKDETEKQGTKVIITFPY